MLDTLFHSLRSRWIRHQTLFKLRQLDDRLLVDLGTSRERLSKFVDSLDIC